MDLDAGTYALVPFTSGCRLKPLEEESNVGRVGLVTSKEDTLTPQCVEALEEIFHRIDLDNNGYVSRTEFDFFQEVTGGEVCDDEAWSIILCELESASLHLILHIIMELAHEHQKVFWVVLSCVTSTPVCKQPDYLVSIQ